MKPKIRFKGFEGEWKEYSLGEVGSIYSGIGFPECEQGGRSGIPFYKVSDMNNQGNESIMHSSNNYVSDKQIQRNHWKICSETPAIFFAKVGAAVMLNRKRIVLEPCLCDNNTMMFSLSKDKWSTNFALPLFNNVDFPSLAQVGSLPSFNGSQVKEIKVKLPKFEEQEMVGKYFTSLDSQISASTSRLASLKQMKAASLQAMFPQEGETVPKIRFRGFEGEWKKVMFSETFEFLKNNSLSRAELSNEGDIVNVHYGDVLIKYGDLLNIQKEELTFIADNKIGNTLYNSCHLQNGDIIIADAAEDNTVGKCSEIVNICNKRVVSGLHTIPCRPLNRFAQGYLGHYINSASYHNQLLPLIQGSKISSISKKTLSQTIVLVPSIEEQKCIGNYFTSLDRQISLQSQRLEKLKQIKSACLDKMFV